jgi:hypothetical protein
MLAAPKSTLGSVAQRRRIPFLASQGSNRWHHRRDVEFMFHAARAPMKLGYTQLAYQSRVLALAGLLFSQRLVAYVLGRS